MIRSGLFGQGGEAAVLLGVAVSAEVLAGHACAVVRQRYRNDEKAPIEAVYTFPLPSKAVLTGFSMTVNGRRLEGEVHEREEAFRRYDDAITAGHGGALLEQERPNVFTANVGNLLPGEETIIEVKYIEPVLADEGAVRWSIPTLVAPRYIPGVPSGDRTAHGTAQPTDRVPDADRISPPIGDVAYGLALDLVFDLGVALEVECPSHAVVIRHEGAEAKKVRVTFAQAEVPLDRDVVVTAFAKPGAGITKMAPIATAVTHRQKDGKPGTLALTLVPDLGAGSVSKRAERSDVVFVLDRSGSMGGASMPEARTALRLCLRQLREGDRFNILAFDDSIEAFSPQMVTFTQTTLQRADAWLGSVDARGGTELLQPMLEAAKLAADGIIVVLTDGEVGNEDEILAAFIAERRTARVYSFGIGTNVSDALLRALADKTGGAVETIYPGERIEEKVVAQFARATAPRVTDVTIKTRGIDLGEIAPAEPQPLVDSEPYCLFATYDEPGRGVIEIRGKLDGEAFFLEIPVDLEADSDRPVVAKLWAQARIRDLERHIVTGRRAYSMKDRIVKLASEYGVSSKYTSFVVVEKRTGDRRVSGQAATRVVPVSPPAGWAMPIGISAAKNMQVGAGRRSPVRPAAMPMGMMRGASGMAPPAPKRSLVSRAIGAITGAPKGEGGADGFSTGAPPPIPAMDSYDDESDELASVMSFDMEKDAGAAAPAPEPLAADASRRDDVHTVLSLLARQGASGLWEEPGRDVIAVTAQALLALLRLGVSAGHPVYGAQIKKATDALLAYVQSTRGSSSAAAELALGVAWLVSTGRRTRGAIEDAARASATCANLSSMFGSEPLVRAHVDKLASA